MSSNSASVLLITECNPQSHLFIDYVRQQLQCEVMLLEPGEEIDIPGTPALVVLLDNDHVDEATMHQWQGLAAENPTMVLAAFNLRDEEHASDVLASLHLQGVFFRRDTLELICKGIGLLLKGDLWMSRTLMARLIDFYRRQQLNAYRPVCGLTHRELEIVGLLGSGASNTKIADQLFISEHTVKSHLYNIFRKIKVRNRIQAMNWARQHVGPPSAAHVLNHRRLKAS